LRETPDTVRIYDEGDTLDGDTMLPDFTLIVKDIFVVPRFAR
jgi:hypothetical protein